MSRYIIKKRNDGRWEAQLEGSTAPLLLFDTADDLHEFTKAMAKEETSASDNLIAQAPEQELTASRPTPTRSRSA